MNVFNSIAKPFMWPILLLFGTSTLILISHGCASKQKSVVDGNAFAGMANGSVAISSNGGSSWTIAAHDPDGSAVNSIFSVAGTVIYAGTAKGNVEISSNSGSSWTATTHQPDGSAVNSIFVTNDILYAGTAKGNVEISKNGGGTWTATTKQPDGSAVNSIFVTSAGVLYAGTTNGNVEISTNGGVTWTAINGKPDSSAVKSVFVTSNAIYAATANEYVYKSTSVKGGGSWSLYAQSVYSLFVNADGNIYSGTQGGYVFSLSQGTQLEFVASSPINSIFFLN